MRTPKSFEEGMERLNTLLAQMQSRIRPLQIRSNCMQRPLL